jgi:uncharacterized protein YhaN
VKISGAYIDGFGIFHDQAISGLDRNLVLLYGHNEAGKSTLLGFIRSVLFGFPRANSKDPLYKPTAGGDHGGRIDLLTDNQETWSISRKPGKGGGMVTVTDSDGGVYDKARLQELLGGISYEAFRSIMAFGLTELQTMDTLSGEHITSAIYGAGLGTSMNAMPRALKLIRKNMDDLFKNRASTKIINRIAGELDRIGKQLQEASLTADTYDALVDELSETEKEVTARRKKLEVCRREHQQYEALERLWPDWISHEENRRELEDLASPTHPFPDDGLEVLETLAEKRDRYDSRVRELKTRQTQLSQRSSGLPVDEKILARASEIGFLLENRNAYLENVSGLPVTRRDVETLEEKITQCLSRLGSGWTEETVLGFDRSLFTRETIRRHQRTLEGLEKQRVAIETLFRDKKAAAHQASDALGVAEKGLAGAGEMPPKRNPDQIQRLGQGRERFSDALAESRELSNHLSEAENERHRLEQAVAQMGPDRKWPAIALGALGLCTAGASAWLERWNVAAIILVAALAAEWGFLVHLRHRRQLRFSRQELVRRQQLRVEELSTRGRHLESIQNDYARLAEVCGAPGTADIGREGLLGAVDRFFSSLSEEESRRETVTRARHLVEEKKADEAAARQALRKTAADLQALEEQKAENNNAWSETCGRFGLSGDLSPETALDALDVMEELLGIRQQRDRSRSEASRLDGAVSDYRRQARQVLSEVSWPATDDEALPHAVAELRDRLEESRGNQREREALAKQMADNERELEAAEKALLETGAAVKELLDTAGLTDEAAFRKAGRMERRRSELQAAVRLAEGNMRRISGEVDTAALKNRLGPLSLADVTLRKTEAAEAAGLLDDELSGLYERRAELKQTLETLSTSEDIRRLRARQAELSADLAAHARDWSRHALAASLIDQARDIYERKHQPEIIKDAGDIFRGMTDGKYTGVVSPLGENTILAVDKNGERVPPEHLSRGTAEQLYLAVRFSYTRHQAQKSDPLPVIMDDILVNFDPVRARKAAEAIRDLSSSHQVLMFTCHPETVEIFRDIDPGLPVFILDRGRISPPEQPLTLEQSSPT